LRQPIQATQDDSSSPAAKPIRNRDRNLLVLGNSTCRSPKSRNLLTKKAIKVKCTCGHAFSVALDYRSYFRKNVKLPGTLHRISSDEALSDITITSLSVSGIGFETTSLRHIYINSDFEVEFKLDDNSHTVIRERICIKRISGLTVGAEFTEQDSYNFDLDFYIAPSVTID
jgi:hypothetical protein